MKNGKSSGRVLFIIDPLTNLNPSLDTSIRWMWCYKEKKWDVFAVSIDNFSLRAQNLFFNAREVKFLNTLDSISLHEPNSMEANSFDHIHMRKDPPFDMNYVSALWILNRSQSRIYNNPHAILNLNEKISILDFPFASKPALVSSLPEEICDYVIHATDGHAVIKPLNLFGGRGVEQVTFGTDYSHNLQKITKLLSAQPGYKIVQQFDDSVFKGEVRAFCVHGAIVAWCLKIPQTGNFLANTAAGAVLKTYIPLEIEIERVVKVAEILQEKGVSVVGFDLIGGYISEINITSPRLLLENFSDLLPFSQCVDKFITG